MIKIKYILISLMIVLGNISYANEDFLNEISTGKAVIVSGIKEAKKNVQTEFIYNENSMYTIYARMNYASLVYMEPGENITSVKGGDTDRWEITNFQTGSKDGLRDAILIKPISLELKTNLIISTNKRTYILNVHSAKELFNPVVKWIYPQEIKIKKAEKENKEEKMTLTDPTELNYEYSVSTKKYDFVPSTIFDDGAKTFLIMKEKLQELPSFYIREGKELLLVNYRVKGNYLIVDRTFQEGVLRIGKKQVIIKKRG